MGLVKMSERGISMKQMNLIAAGGAAMNIVGEFLNNRRTDIEDSTCVINACFIDTSKSNFSKAGIALDDERVYILDGKDGRGKKRDMDTYEVVSEHANEILHQYKPSDINVIIHSASGGSGSVIGPVLASELLSRKCPVILIVLGSTDSMIEVDNTIKTLKGYEVLSKNQNKPVNVIYYENSTTTPRDQVDTLAQSTISLLAVIFSGKNHGLDSEDLVNFLHYQNVTQNEPQLVLVDFFYNEFKIPKGQSVISAVTLTDKEHSSSLPIVVDYQAVGFLSDTASKQVSVELPINMVNVMGFFPAVIERLEKYLTEIKDMRQSTIIKRIEVTDGIANERGLIF